MASDPLLALASQLVDQGAYDGAAEWVCAHISSATEERAAGLHEYLARLLAQLGRHADAIAAADRAFTSGSGSAVLASNIAWTLLRIGNAEQAVAWSRRAITLAPGNGQMHSNVLVTSLYCARFGAAEVFDIHREWRTKFDAEPPALSRIERDRAPERPLRVGYVSADFRRHPAAAYILHLLGHHTRPEFKVFAYAQVLRRDSYTEIAIMRSDCWREITGMSDEQAAALIAADEIDVLVDLTGHFGGSRLGVFALRPAPVQVSFPVYPASTGLRSIAYRLTDEIADPPGATGCIHSERLVYLPRCFACFENLEPPPEPGPLPFDRNGVITFGAFHSASKINAGVFDLWADVLRRVPGARLVVHNLLGDHPIVPREVYQPILVQLAALGVNSARVRFVPGQDSQDHLRTLALADIALDALPRNGMTTTFESLLMGVPVVAKVGDCHQSRVSLSFLRAVGLDDLAAKDDAGYVETAVRLAADRARLRNLRGSLRSRVERSELMDHSGFARAVEEAYRSMWWGWCRQGTDR